MNRPIFFQEPERPTQRKKPSGRWFSRLIGFVVLVFFIAFLAEGLTRIIWGRSAVLFPAYHESVTYGPYTLRRLQPSTEFRHKSADGTWIFRTNAQGFRDTENYEYEKLEGLKRVLCLGDSQTQGFEARQDQTFPAVLERRLGRLGHRVQVLNAGIAGFGTAEQLAFLEQEGARYQPDVVVLGWYINDLSENEKSGLFRVEEGVLKEGKFAYAPGASASSIVNNAKFLRWASEHSYLYSMLFQQIGEAQKILRAHKAGPAEKSDTRLSYKGAEIRPQQLELAGALVKRLHGFCKAKGIKLIIVDIPWVPVDNTGFGSSIPPALAQTFRENSECLLRADDVLGPYLGVADLFVPRGQYHISETSHLMLGMKVAEKISAWFDESVIR